MSPAIHIFEFTPREEIHARLRDIERYFNTRVNLAFDAGFFCFRCMRILGRRLSDRLTTDTMPVFQVYEDLGKEVVGSAYHGYNACVSGV